MEYSGCLWSFIDESKRVKRQFSLNEIFQPITFSYQWDIMLLSQKFNNTMPIFHFFTYFTLFHYVINYHGL